MQASGVRDRLPQERRSVQAERMHLRRARWQDGGHRSRLPDGWRGSRTVTKAGSRRHRGYGAGGLRRVQGGRRKWSNICVVRRSPSPKTSSGPRPARMVTTQAPNSAPRATRASKERNATCSTARRIWTAHTRTQQFFIVAGVHVPVRRKRSPDKDYNSPAPSAATTPALHASPTRRVMVKYRSGPPSP